VVFDTGWQRIDGIVIGVVARVEYLGRDNAVEPQLAGRVAQTWWDNNAAEYLTEHGQFLGNADGLPIGAQFRWGPEGVTEAELGLLGAVHGRQILEIGAGAAQCSRWLATQGASTVATDISAEMLAAAAKLNTATGIEVELWRCDARSLPFPDAEFDITFTSFGAIQFIPDPITAFREIHRVLVPGGKWVFSVTHPFRWAFPDDPTLQGLTAIRSYFDRSPYAEFNDDGKPEYLEYHRTIGDYVRDIVKANFTLLDLVELEWPEDNDQVWGGWGPQRGAYLPGTAIFVCEKPL